VKMAVAISALVSAGSFAAHIFDAPHVQADEVVRLFTISCGVPKPIDWLSRIIVCSSPLLHIGAVNTQFRLHEQKSKL